MDRQDQHKRAFSQAFPRMYQPRYGGQHAQPVKRILPDPVSSTSICQQESDQENEEPLGSNTAASFNEAPGTQIHHQPTVDLQYANAATCSHASFYYELYSNGSAPAPALEHDVRGSPLPLLCDQQPRFPLRYDSLSTPQVVRGQSMFGPSPYVRSDLSSSSGSIVGPHAQSGNELSPMSDAFTAVGPLTPGALKFGDLTLNSKGHSLSSSSVRYEGQGGHAAVSVVPVISFARYVCFRLVATLSLIIFRKLPRDQTKRGRHIV